MTNKTVHKYSKEDFSDGDIFDSFKAVTTLLNDDTLTPGQKVMNWIDVFPKAEMTLLLLMQSQQGEVDASGSFAMGVLQLAGFEDDICHRAAELGVRLTSLRDSPGEQDDH